MSSNSNSSAPISKPLFLYGTLQSPLLLSLILTGSTNNSKDFENNSKNSNNSSQQLQQQQIETGRAAILRGYKCLRMRRKAQPCLLKTGNNEDVVMGVLLYLQDSNWLNILDDFEGEGEAHDRVDVDVEVQTTTSTTTTTRTTMMTAVGNNVEMEMETEMEGVNNGDDLSIDTDKKTDTDVKTVEKTVDAMCYVWRGETNSVIDEPWRFEVFVEDNLELWLDIFDGMEFVGQKCE